MGTTREVGKTEGVTIKERVTGVLGPLSLEEVKWLREQVYHSQIDVSEVNVKNKVYLYLTDVIERAIVGR